jgi:heterodisulfide reductase subunit B2
MKIGYYPGCSLESSSKEYSKSLLAVAEKCGIIPEEIKGWSCCGASAAHNLNHDLAIVLPARTLAIAEEQGFTELLVPCAACYRRLAAAQYEVTTNEETHKKVESYLELKFSGKIKILSVIDFLQKYISPVADQYIINNLNQKIACYYGCLLARPKETSTLKRTEDPLEMESVLEKTGAKPINWAFKTECCGASLSVSSTTIVAKLSGKIVENAVASGAESIVVACPMCHMNLDMRRPEIKKQIKKDLDIPVLFITQVLGLSMGIPADKLGLNHHFVSTEKVILSIVKKEA